MPDVVNWRCYWVNMAEPGYIAVHCWRDEAWDQFPLFEGKLDLKNLQDWVGDHEHRHHPETLEAPMSDVTPEATPGQAEEPETRRVLLWLCDPCLDGAGGECHTPGCALWINRAPDLPLRDSPMVTILSATGAEDELIAQLALDMDEIATLRQQLLRTEEQCRRHVNKADAERDGVIAECRQLSEDNMRLIADCDRYRAGRDAAREELAGLRSRLDDLASQWERVFTHAGCARELREALEGGR